MELGEVDVKVIPSGGKPYVHGGMGKRTLVVLCFWITKYEAV